MKPQSAKSKGRRLQQRVAKRILDTFGHLTDDDVRSTSMGAGGEDVCLSARARESVPLSIECKNTERLNVWSALEQCQKNCPASATPCVVFSKNNAGTYAVVPLDALLALYKRVADEGALPPRLASLLRELVRFAPEDAVPRT